MRLIICAVLVAGIIVLSIIFPAVFILGLSLLMLFAGSDARSMKRPEAPQPQEVTVEIKDRVRFE